MLTSSQSKSTQTKEWTWVKLRDESWVNTGTSPEGVERQDIENTTAGFFGRSFLRIEIICCSRSALWLGLHSKWNWLSAQFRNYLPVQNEHSRWTWQNGWPDFWTELQGRISPKSASKLGNSIGKCILPQPRKLKHSNIVVDEAQYPAINFIPWRNFREIHA